MNKNIQPKLHEVKFKCATCGSEFVIMSTINKKIVAIDVCSNCHPFYKDGQTNQKIKGRAEKLSAKFKTAKEKLSSKKTIKSKKTKKNKNKYFKTIDQINNK
jgi:large subunit ribosomal protein L31